jgi:hypothetical protein
VKSAAKRSIIIEEMMPKGLGDEGRSECERNERPDQLGVPTRGRKHRAHQDSDRVSVLFQEGQIRQRLEKFRSLCQSLLDGIQLELPRGIGGSELLLPEVEERLQAQNAAKRAFIQYALHDGPSCGDNTIIGTAA